MQARIFFFILIPIIFLGGVICIYYMQGETLTQWYQAYENASYGNCPSGNTSHLNILLLVSSQLDNGPDNTITGSGLWQIRGWRVSPSFNPQTLDSITYI